MKQSIPDRLRGVNKMFIFGLHLVARLPAQIALVVTFIWNVVNAQETDFPNQLRT